MSLTAPTTTPPIWCVIEDLHHDHDAAADVLAGRFTHAGETLTLGTRPDWNCSPHPDREWGIEWSKFYIGLDLAHAHHNDGHDRYFDAWLDLVTSWIEQRPADSDTSDVTARRVQNWIYAAAAFEHGLRSVTPDDHQRSLIRRSIDEQADHIRANLTAERNHRTLELYALLIVALERRSRGDEDDELTAFATHELYRNLCMDLLDDGVHRELSSHYHAVVLRSFLGTRINADRFGIELPANYDDRLAAGFAFLADVIRPDGSLPLLGDSDDGDHRPLLRLAGEVLERPDFVHVATSGRIGTAPERRVSSYPDAGYHIVRSGWGTTRPFDEEHHLVFDAGPLGPSGHAHYDALHVELAVGGRPLLVDPGRFTYAEADTGTNWRRWFKGTAAHNTVTVDDEDQTPYRAGKPKPPVAHGRLTSLDVRERSVELVGQVISPCYDAIHTRRVVVVDHAWWLIEDILVSHAPHRYTLRFHLAPWCTGSTTLDRAAGRVTTTGADLLVAGPSADAPDLTLVEGWTATEYGIRQPAPVVTASQDGRGTVRWVSAIVPHAVATSAQLVCHPHGAALHDVDGPIWSADWTQSHVEVVQP